MKRKCIIARLFNNGTNCKPKVERRRKRRVQSRTIVKDIIDYHLSEEESTDDNKSDSEFYDDVGNLTTLGSTTFDTTSLPNEKSEDSALPNNLILYEDDVLMDDNFDGLQDLSSPLYENARVSVRNATSQLLDFAMQSNLDKSTTTKLFKLVKNLLPVTNVLPTTNAQILKVLERVSLFQSKFYCNECYGLCVIRNKKRICDNPACSFSNTALKPCDCSEVVDLDISSQLKTIINRNYSLLFDGRKQFQPFDVPHGDQYQSTRTLQQQRITLIIHADGSPLVLTTKSSLWPVFASVVELPHQVREFQSNILVLAMWASCKKPHIDLLMKTCIQQLIEYENNGMRIMANGVEMHIIVQRQMFIADLPAKCLFLKSMNHNGYSACTVCLSKGVWKGQVLYPYNENNNRRRIHAEVVSSGKEAERRSLPVDGIKGVSPMLKILTYPDQIIYDYMHLVCLGHTATLIRRWLPFLERSNLAAIDDLLDTLRLPHNINVAFNHSINEMSEWHAKHFRLFVLNIGLPCIAPYLPTFIASHFAVYCLAIKLLHCPKSLDEINFAQSLIDYYCRAAPQVYDQSIELLSLHAHLHLAEQVKRHGGLGFSSAFCFESCIRYLKKMVHGTKDLASQMAFWCDLRAAVHRPEFSLQPRTGKTKISIGSKQMEKYRSILLNNLRTIGHDDKQIILFLRYKDVFNTYHSVLYDQPFKCASFIVSYKTSDTDDNRFGNVILIYQFKDDFFALLQEYNKVNVTMFDFFDLPTEISASLNENFTLRRLSESYGIIPVNSIQHKAVSVPFRDYVCLSEFRLDFEHD